MARVPLVDLAAQEASVAPEVLAAIADVAREARFVLGARVEAFEELLAAQAGVRHVVGVASGTDALELSLRALGIGPGDAVVTPAFSFIAAAEAIAATGARPVFCDVDAATLNADVASVRQAVVRATDAGLRVRAVVPVDLFGLCAPRSALGDLAKREHLVLVEDAAQALGARDDAGRPAGSAGDAGAMSFFPTKNLGAWGDGGAVLTSRDDVASRVRRLRAHGATSAYVHAEAGRNSRLDALQAAVLLAKAPHLETWNAARSRLASRYLAELALLPLVLPHRPAPPAVAAWHAFVVRSPRRDVLASFLRERGVETRVYYPVPLHRQECFADLHEPELPVTEEACRTALALPLFTTMSDEQQAYVLEQVAAFHASPA
jgi:dTDP-4-amino-4,6-dideoxygalactose transaminase